MIKEVTRHVANETGLVIGTNLFAGFFPQDAIDNCSAILDNGGLGDYYLTDKLELAIQVLTRGEDYHVTKSQADSIYDVYNGGKRITLPNEGDGIWIVNSSTAIQSPQSIGQDDKNRFQFSANYILRISRP